MAKKMSFSFALLFGATSLFAHTNYSLKDFEAPRDQIVKVQFVDYRFGMYKLNQLHYDIAGVDIKNKTADLIVNDLELKNLEDKGFNIINQYSKYLMRGPDAEYKTSVEIEEILKAAERNFPEIVKVYEIGKSLQGRTIFAVKITTNPTEEKSFKPRVLFNGMHHAREVMGPEVVLDILETLTTGFETNSEISNWVTNNEIWLLPMFNVDGNNLVWTSDSMWRKNARDNYGVDINRNYPYAWGSCNGSSSYKSAQDYRGESAASEPETKVMMNFISKIRPVFDISYHSYSELVIYPMGCNGKRTKNSDVVEGIGKELGRLVNYTPGTAWETLYSVDGSDIDWMYSEYQVIPYVLEVNSSSEGFQPPFKVRNKTVERNRPAWMHLLKRLEGPGIRLRKMDFDISSLADFSATVFIKNGSEFKEYMAYRGKPDGTIDMILNPGEYQVTLTYGGNVLKLEPIKVTDKRIDVQF